MLVLSELDISIEKPKAIKSQALIELLKYTKHDSEEIMFVEDNEECWILYFDGTSTYNEGSAGIVLSNVQDKIFKNVVKLAFPCSNNKLEYEAEYEALAFGLDLQRK